jgi:hypothetical protein
MNPSLGTSSKTIFLCFGVFRQKLYDRSVNFLKAMLCNGRASI